MTREEIVNEIKCILSELNNGEDAVSYLTQSDIKWLNENIKALEPRKGHWIECMPRGAEEWCYKCSECNFWKYKKIINLSKFKFCPNCGCRMVEPQESEG